MGCGITKDSNPRKEWEEERQQIDDDEKGVVGEQRGREPVPR
jgi:hypothetical protein